MAQRACLILLRLIVERRRGRCARIDVEGMTFEAQQIDLAALQQSRVGRAVRRVAGDTTFGFHDRVFVHEGSGLIRMALEAQRVLRRGGAQLARQKSAVGVVAIAALREPFIDPVDEGKTAATLLRLSP